MFLEFGLFTSSLDYWKDNWQVVPAILGYGLVLGGAMAIWSVALSAYLKKLVPIAVTWSSLFVLLSRLAIMMPCTATSAPASRQRGRRIHRWRRCGCGCRI